MLTSIPRISVRICFAASRSRTTAELPLGPSSPPWRPRAACSRSSASAALSSAADCRAPASAMRDTVDARRVSSPDKACATKNHHEGPRDTSMER